MINYQLAPDAPGNTGTDTDCGTASEDATFTIFLIEVVTTAINDMELAVGQPSDST